MFKKIFLKVHFNGNKKARPVILRLLLFNIVPIYNGPVHLLRRIFLHSSVETREDGRGH